MKAHELFNRILVGVDSEGRSADAVLQGATLARRLGTRLDLVHAVQVPSPLWPGVSENELAGIHATALSRARKEVVESLNRTLRSAGMEEPVDDLLRIYPGHPAQVILKRAEESGTDLIILGAHAKRPFFDFGSTTRAILSRSNSAVWTQSEPVTPVESILVPVDFSEHSRIALSCAHALATRLEASLRVLYCYAPPTFAYSGVADAIPGPTYVVDHEREAAKEELERWTEALESGSVRAACTFVEGDAVTRILQQSKKDGLIVMGTHGRTGLSRFLIGSVAYGVVKRSENPVLVIPSPNRTWLLTENESEEPAPADADVPLSLS